MLADDRHVIPPYDAVVLASARLARDAPDVLAALRPLAGAIDADTMRHMNVAVDQNGESPPPPSRTFLAVAPAGAQPRAVARSDGASPAAGADRGARANAGGNTKRSRTARRRRARPAPARRASRSAASTSASVARVVGCGGVKSEQQS